MITHTAGRSASRDRGVHLSVVICSHNPRPDYLGRVLAALKAQTLNTDEWELILVDNASREPLASACDLTWHPHAAHVREEVLGLTPARVRGIVESSAELVVFVDDDNVLEPTYLERARALARRRPDLGVFGAGLVHPEFEAARSPRLEPRLRMLALRAVPSPLWTNNPHDVQSLPCGAGLCVVRSVATAYVQWVGRLKVNEILDRRGERLFCGGDDLFSFVAVRGNYGFGVFPELRIRHLIPRFRLTEAYLLRLIHDHSYSHGVLRYLLFSEKPRRLGIYRIARILLHGTRRGRFSMRCQWRETIGAERAARFVTASGLRPVEAAELQQPVSRMDIAKPQSRTAIS